MTTTTPETMAVAEATELLRDLGAPTEGMARALLLGAQTDGSIPFQVGKWQVRIDHAGDSRFSDSRFTVTVTARKPSQGAPEFPATWEGGHALVIEFGDEELLARCQCGVPLGTGTPATPLDSFSPAWERHVMGT